MPPPARPRLPGALAPLRPDLRILTRPVADRARVVETEVIALPSISPEARTGVPAVVAGPLREGSRMLLDRSRLRLDRLAHIRDLLGAVRRDSGIARSQVTAPIAATAVIDDKSRYADPTAPDKLYYIPRYRLDMPAGKYGVQLGKQDGTWRLQVRLVRTAAPEVVAAGGGEPIDDRLAVSFHYDVALAPAGANLRKTLVFDEVVTEGPPDRPVIVATAVLGPDDAQRDAVFLAMSTASAAPRLEVVRTVRIATPHVRRKVLPKTRFELSDRVLGPRRPELPRPELPRPELPRPELPPRPVEPLFDETDYALPWSVDPQGSEPPGPFLIPAIDANTYVYSGIIGDVEVPAPTPHVIAFESRPHVYYQDPAERERFYYLPDSFKLLRRDELPYLPAMLLALSPGATARDEMQVSLDFAAGPYVRRARLDAAAIELEKHLPAGGGKTIVLEPLSVSNLELSLRLPTDSGVVELARPSARVSTEELRDVISLPLSRFREVFAAMCAERALLFDGTVRLGASADVTHAIPFIGRFGELTGKVLATSFTPHAASGGVALSLTNAIESPLAIASVRTELRYGEVTIAGAIDGLVLPLALAAGETVSLIVAPAAPPPAGIEAVALLTLDGVDVQIDREAVLEAITQGEVLPDLKREVRVKSHGALFAATADPLLAIVVQFEHGDTVDLDATRLEAVAGVRTPMPTLLLGALDDQPYRYKRTIIRLSGQQSDADWRTGTASLFYPDLNVAPRPAEPT